MCETKTWFTEYQELEERILVELGDRRLVFAEGRGRIEINAFN